MRFEEQEQTENKQQDEKKSYFGWLFKFTTSAFIATVLLVAGTLTVFNYNNSAESTPKEVNATSEDNTIDSTDSNSSVVQAVEKASDAVVGVVKYGQSAPLSENSKAGTGSGVIYKKENGEAYVVTNHHVIDNAQSLEVILSSGDKVKAELLGSDPLTDLAVLKISADKVKQVAQFGSSDELKVGETAIAIGNPLGMKFAGSVTKGIISGKERTMPIDLNKDGNVDWKTDVLQTDAAINPGNSGGALVNIQGEVIGINSMKIAKEQVEGLGFAIPTSTALPIIEDLEKEGEVTRPYMGIQTRDLSTISNHHLQNTLKLPKDIQSGVLVGGVQQGTPAAEAGLQKYDAIVQVDGQKVESLVDLRKYLYEEKSVGDSIEIQFYRDGQKQTASLQLAK
ncbi:S1C family serine protease [Pontibacillus sp. HMF3514]|uniref:S1C family serine protease n=1 Tax=Pontibacillus sp. HMF3514 TaxID=2692425 RepID=UPI00131FA9B8|nr:trypsin-like peptidase domain-containing protein [Pontibacillus sp. HMF3514]QHE53977.1 PDZ domain-containing protein [Pontibacillus sp. HMF3514]